MIAAALTINDKNLVEILSQFSGVDVAVSAGSFIDQESPYPQERELVVRAVASRRAEFFAGRYYSRLALQQINCVDAPILRGEKGNPLWPAGVLGSITHDLGQVVVAVTRSNAYRGMGIDLLLDPVRVEPSLQSLIAQPAELEALMDCDKNAPVLALAFSLKESVVKAVSPGINKYLDLAEIVLSVEKGKIRAELRDLGLHLACGFIHIHGGLLSFAFLTKE